VNGRALGPALFLTLSIPLAQAAAFDAFSSAAIEPKLGVAIPRDLAFVDEAGGHVALADYLGQRPVILAPVAYNCKNICGVTLAGLFSALAGVGLNPRSFAVVAVSIDPRETVADAMRSRAENLTRYGRAGAAEAVHFLAAADGAGSSRALAETIGFHYAYDADTDQFAHPAAVAVITPSGKLARWLYGYPFEPSDLRLALTEAGEGTIGTLSDRLWLLCYGYDPKTGAYTADVDLALKAGGGLTMLLVGGFVAFMLRRERRRPGSGP
jgi:protein SCO1/2